MIRVERHAKRHVAVGSVPSAAAALLRAVPAGRSAGQEAQPRGLVGGWVQTLPAHDSTVGRSLDNAVVLADPLASRHHARIARNSAEWEVANLSQRQPLWLDDREVTPGATGVLTPGSVLRIGDTRLQFLAPAAYAANEGSQHAGAAVDDQRAREWLRPGITFQFAMSGRSRAMGWRLALLGGVALLGATAALTAALLVAVGQRASLDGGAAHALASAAVALIPALATTLLVLLADRYEREPWPLLIAGFVWGAVVAIPLAVAAENAATNMLAALPLLTPSPRGSGALAPGIGNAIVAGAVEEVVKGAGLVLLLLALRDQFDNVTDGILYGVVVGAGFAVVENFTYLALSAPEERPWIFLGRIVLGWLGHSTFCALFGAGLGLARESHRRSAYLRAPALAFLAALGFHTLFDVVLFLGQSAAQDGVAPSVASFAGIFVAYGSLFAAEGLVVLLLVRSLRREAEVIREQLAVEVLAGTVTADEYAIVQDGAVRWRAEIAALRAAGPRAYVTARALYQAVIGLAMRRWHVSQGEAAKPTAEQPEDAYRARIARDRAGLIALLSGAQ